MQRYRTKSLRCSELIWYILGMVTICNLSINIYSQELPTTSSTIFMIPVRPFTFYDDWLPIRFMLSSTLWNGIDGWPMIKQYSALHWHNNVCYFAGKCNGRRWMIEAHALKAWLLQLIKPIRMQLSDTYDWLRLRSDVPPFRSGALFYYNVVCYAATLEATRKVTASILWLATQRKTAMLPRKANPRKQQQQHNRCSKVRSTHVDRHSSNWPLNSSHL